MYNDNLNDEKKPVRKILLSAGWRTFQFKNGNETTSKAGNSMFKMSIEDKETGYIEDIYLVRTKGKRWLLKCVLVAFDIALDADGNYTYDLPELLNKDIRGFVEHEPNEYIDRNGVTVTTTQHKIIDFKKVDEIVNPGNVTTPDEIKVQW